MTTPSAEWYLTRQRRTVAAVHREIARQCRIRGLRVPSRGTVLRRIEQLDPVKSTSAREGSDAARPLRSAGGVPPEVTELLEQVQIDHTPVDLIVPFDAVATAIEQAILWELAEGKRPHGDRGEFIGGFVGLYPKTARLLGWYIQHKPPHTITVRKHRAGSRNRAGHPVRCDHEVPDQGTSHGRWFLRTSVQSTPDIDNRRAQPVGRPRMSSMTQRGPVALAIRPSDVTSGTDSNSASATYAAS